MSAYYQQTQRDQITELYSDDLACEREVKNSRKNTKYKFFAVKQAEDFI